MQRSNTYSILFILFVFTISSFNYAQDQNVIQKDSLKVGVINSINSTNAEQGHVDFTDGTNSLIRITDEGNFGAIEIKSGVPSTTTYKLYNDAGTLKFNGSSLGGSGATSIDGLTDAKAFGTSQYIGLRAGFLSSSTDYRNTALGYYSLYNNDIGENNTAIGDQTLVSNTTGSNNTAVGYNSLFSNVTGVTNTAVGSQALANSLNSYNTAIGYKALYANINGSFNTALGLQALLDNTIGDYNVALGSQALDRNIAGSNNIGIGAYANRNNEDGSNNTIIGYLAGGGTVGITHSKSGNVFLGYQAGYDEYSDNKLYIENSDSDTPLIWGDFANDIAAINGKLGVGTMSPDAKVTIIAASTGEIPLRVKIGSATKFKVEENGGVAIGLNSSTTPENGLYVHGDLEYNGALTSVSDRRYKTNIQAIPNSMQLINSINGVYYDWKRDEFPERDFTDKKQIGVIAQEVESVLPELVSTNSEGYKSVDYSKLTAVLIEAVKEQDQRIIKLEQENEKLVSVLNEMNSIKAALNKLEKEQSLEKIRLVRSEHNN